jgi:hypothetical protein
MRHNDRTNDIIDHIVIEGSQPTLIEWNIQPSMSVCLILSGCVCVRSLNNLLKTWLCYIFSKLWQEIHIIVRLFHDGILSSATLIFNYLHVSYILYCNEARILTECIMNNTIQFQRLKILMHATFIGELVKNDFDSCVVFQMFALDITNNILGRKKKFTDSIEYILRQF